MLKQIMKNKQYLLILVLLIGFYFLILFSYSYSNEKERNGTTADLENLKNKYLNLNKYDWRKKEEISNEFIKAGKIAIPVILQIIETAQHYNSKRYAFKTLGEIGDKSIADFLIKSARAETNTLVLLEIIDAIIKLNISNQLTIEMKAGIFQKCFADRNYLTTARKRITNIFDNLPEDEKNEILKQMLLSEVTEARRYAAYVLRNTTDKEMIPILIKRVEEDKDWWVRTNCFRALVSIGDKATTRFFLKYIINDNGTLRQEAEKGLKKSVDKSYLPMLWQMFDDENNTHKQASILRVIAKIADKSVVPKTIEILKDKKRHHSVRSIACYIVVNKLKAEEALPVLIENLNDKVGFVKADAIVALGNLGNPEAVPYLIRVFKQEKFPYHFRKGRAAEALGKIGDKRAIPVLKKALEDKSRGHEIVNIYVLDALVKLGEISYKNRSIGTNINERGHP